MATSQLIQKTKEAAARRFVDALLRHYREDVAEIHLFGSVAKGHPRPESDVDLLVFALKDVRFLRETASAISFDVTLDIGESVEPVVLPLRRRFEHQGLFVHDVLKRGKVLYAMPEEELHRAEFTGRLELARSYQQVAEYVFENGDFRQAADLAYNASELVAKALLMGRVEQLPTTHSGIVTLFGQHLARPGIVSRELGRELSSGLEIRNRARYDHTATVEESEARRLLDLIRRLLAEAAP